MDAKPPWKLTFDTFDIIIIIVTITLLVIAGALGAFSGPPDRRPSIPIIQSEPARSITVHDFGRPLSICAAFLRPKGDRSADPGTGPRIGQMIWRDGAKTN
jgi:hypothetical protein